MAKKATAEHAVVQPVAETASAAPAVERVTPPQEAEKASGKTVKVEILRSHPEFGYFPGDKGEISQESFDRISQDGEFFKKL